MASPRITYCPSSYSTVLLSTLEYGAQVWNGNLTQPQSRSDIEMIQKRALKIILALYNYNQALGEINQIFLKDEELRVTL